MDIMMKNTTHIARSKHSSCLVFFSNCRKEKAEIICDDDVAVVAAAAVAAGGGGDDGSCSRAVVNVAVGPVAAVNAVVDVGLLVVFELAVVAVEMLV